MKIAKYLILLGLIVQLNAQTLSYKKPIILNYDGQDNSLINYHETNPLLTAKDSMHTLYVHSDSTIFFSWVLNQENGQDYIMRNEPFDHYYSIPEGKYHLIVAFKDKNTYPSIFYYKDINLDKTTTVIVDKDSCNIKQTLEITDIEQKILNYKNIPLMFYQNNEVKLIINVMSSSIIMNKYTVMFNKYPDTNLNLGYRIVSKPNNLQKDYYYVAGKFKNVDSSIVIKNDINNLNHANFKYYFGNSFIPDEKDLRVEFYPPGHFYPDDPKLEWPINISVYQDITYSEVLKWANFYNIVEIGDNTWGDLMTLQLKIGKDRVYGKLFSNKEIYIPLSETNDIIFGLTPSFFNGKMYNTQDSIRIFGKWGWNDYDDNHNQLFLSQSNDAFIQNPIHLKIRSIVKDSTLIIKDIFLPELGGEVNISMGLPRNLLVYSLPQDNYEVTITNDKNEIAGIPSTVTAKAVCDLTKEDKNPPGLNSFQIVGGNSLSHTLQYGNVNKIRFFPVDDSGINTMELFYKEENDPEWHNLEIGKMDEYYYQTVLPDLSMGTYSLKLLLTDSTGNKLEMRQEPAFIYSSPDYAKYEKDLNVNEYTLSSGYPNPFNMEVNFIYNIPVNSNGKIKIEVYNILGERVRTLINGATQAGKHTVKWDGRNDAGNIMPSGIYLIKFTSKINSITRKIVLMK